MAYEPAKQHHCRVSGGAPRETVSDASRRRAVKDPCPATNAERIRRCRARKLAKDGDAMRKDTAVARTCKAISSFGLPRKMEHIHLRKDLKGDAEYATSGSIAYLPFQQTHCGWQVGEVDSKYVVNSNVNGPGLYLIVEQEKSTDHRRRKLIAVPANFAFSRRDVRLPK